MCSIFKDRKEYQFQESLLTQKENEKEEEEEEERKSC
ncbi:hypothetical protein SLEP1_g39611 [Rubroshorea leprosula]|uniref:Uncharacterized protein n=1 Tax=Rubroshorea leprosula TaxID=152421 RepID=A0AAV5L1J3_9ROSI|nr:hypothetical protein SLEP1_g39611 [Rubroshorea leprosula]